MTSEPRAVAIPLGEALARAAVPAAGLAAMAALAAHEVDPIAGAEGGYLAVVAAAVLAPVAFLAPAPAWEVGLGAVLATAAAWALPAGPGRGAAVALVLVAALAVAAGRRLARSAGALPLAVTVPLALGLQALLRSDLLLRPRGMRAFALLLALPLAGAVATSLLSRRHGRRAAVAAGLALAATPGWTIATTLALAALAGGDEIRALVGGGEISALAGGGGRGASASGGPRADRGTAGAPNRPAMAGGSWRTWAARAGALAAILLPVAWSPRAGWPGAAAGLALASPALGLGGAAALAVVSAVLPASGAADAGAIGSSFAGHPGSAQAGWTGAALAGLALLAIAVLCVPAICVPAMRPAARRWRWAVSGLLLAFAARAFAPAGAPALAALAAPLALLALATRDAGPAAMFQRTWAAALVGGAALFAAYPWLRAQPLGDFLALLGPAPLAAIVALVAVFAIATEIVLFTLPNPSPAQILRSAQDDNREGRAQTPSPSSFVAGDSRWATQDDMAEAVPRPVSPPTRGNPIAPAGVALALLFVGILVHLPPPATPLLPPGGAVRLSAGAPAWEALLPAGARGVALVSSLENGAGIAPGAAVASLAVDPGARFTVAAGRGTADWAARRADVARALAARGEAAPRPWLSWVAGDFFGQRYRRVFALPEGTGRGGPRRLRLELARGLPPAAALAVYRLEALR